MLALIILGILAVLIFLICMITVGVDVEYVGGELTVSAKICGFLLQLIPRRKPAPEKKEKPPEEPKPEKKKPKKSAKRKRRKAPA